MSIYRSPVLRFAVAFIVFSSLGLWMNSANSWLALFSVLGILSTFGIGLVVARYSSTASRAIYILHQLQVVFYALFAASLVLSLHTLRARRHIELADIVGEGRIEAEFEGVALKAPRPGRYGWTYEIAIRQMDERRFNPGNKPKIFLFYPHSLIDPLSPEVSQLALPGDIIQGFIRLQAFEPASIPHDISMRDYMAARQITARATTQEYIEVIGQKRSLWLSLQRLLAKRKLHFEILLLRHLDPDQAAISLAMLTATRSLIRPEFRYAFDTTGTSHLIAISGLHLSVLAAILWYILGQLSNLFPSLLRRFGRRRICGIGVMTLLALYVLMIGAPTSACRALLMVSLGIVALTSMRPFCSIHALAAAACILVIWRPTLLGELGFQLSFAATAGILFFLRIRPQWMRRPIDPFFTDTLYQKKKRAIGIFIGVSTSATLSTWPVIWPTTGELPLAGLWLNFIVVPLVSSIIFPLLVAGAIISFLWQAAGLFIIGFAADLMIWMQVVLEKVLLLPGSTWRWGIPNTLEWIAVTLAIVLVVVGGYRRIALLCAALCLCIASLPSLYSLVSPPPEQLRVHFLPVGQGDATLVEFPDGQTLLIDAGGQPRGRDPGLSVVLPYLKRLGIRQLDYLLLTHAHHDHMNGINALVTPFRPRYFIYDMGEESDALQRLLMNLQAANTELIPVHHEKYLQIGQQSLTLVRPGGDNRGSTNDVSLVTSFHYGRTGLLFPGDIERESEQWMVQYGIEPTTILKMPHHGSNTSSTTTFLNATQPAIAIASAGRFNRFGHPHPDVIARYKRRGTTIFRTDKHGLIVMDITPDGEILVRTALY